MPALEWSQFRKNIQERRFDSIVFLFGEDTYLMNVAFQELKEAVVEVGLADFNFDVFYASDAQISQVRDTIETLPMMTQHRLVALKEVQEFSDAEWADLEPVIRSPVDSTILFLMASKIDKRKRYFKLLQEHATCVEVKRPYENQMEGWVHYIARIHRVKLQSEGVNQLCRLIGNNLLEMDSAIYKISLYLDGKAEITSEDISRLVARSREDSIFELTDAIGELRRERALRLLAGLLEQGQNEIGVVSLIARHVRILLSIQESQRLGFKGQNLSARVGIPHFTLNRYLDQSRRWNQKKLEHTLVMLAETDKALKSLPVSSHIWLENFVVKTCSQNLN